LILAALAPVLAGPKSEVISDNNRLPLSSDEFGRDRQRFGSQKQAEQQTALH
jgi:hypothetical protein